MLFALLALAGRGGRPGAGAVADRRPAARGAGGPHPGAGAGRGRRGRARPGAAHARPDPAQRRRLDQRRAAGPRPGTHPARTGSTSRRARRASASPPRSSRPRPRSRTRTASRVETVVVGDADHDERVAALVAATREALVNAARHAKVGTVSLYAEAEEEQFSVFVRDRGAGFDLSTCGRRSARRPRARSSGGCSATVAWRRFGRVRARAPRWS